MTDPIDESVRARMNNIAEKLDRGFNGDAHGKDRKWGFALLTFPFNEVDGMRVNYISNATREQMLVALKELVSRWEAVDVEETRP